MPQKKGLHDCETVSEVVAGVSPGQGRALRRIAVEVIQDRRMLEGSGSDWRGFEPNKKTISSIQLPS